MEHIFGCPNHVIIYTLILYVILQVITKCFFSYILNPVLVAPELHGILESPETVQITLVQRKNLSIIGKILQNTAAGVGVSYFSIFLQKCTSLFIHNIWFFFENLLLCKYHKNCLLNNHCLSRNMQSLIIKGILFPHQIVVWFSQITLVL